MQTQPRERACSPLHPFFPWTSAINPVIQIESLWCKEQACDAKSKPVMQIFDHDRPFIINWCICCIIILRAERDHTFCSLPHQPPQPICPRARILLLLPRRFISAPPPLKFYWCQGTAYCTHETCQARRTQQTLTSLTSTSLYGLNCTASHTMM